MKVFLLVVIAAVYVQAEPTPFALQVREYTALFSTTLRAFKVQSAAEYHDKVKEHLRPVIRLKMKNSAERMEGKMQVLFNRWQATYAANSENDERLARGLMGFSAKIARAHGEAKQHYQDNIKPLLTDSEKVVLRRYFAAMSTEVATMQTTMSAFFDTNLKPTVLQLAADAQAQTLTDDDGSQTVGTFTGLSPFAESVKQYLGLMHQKVRENAFQVFVEYQDKVKDQLSREVRVKVKTLSEKMKERTQTAIQRFSQFFKVHKDDEQELVRGLSAMDAKLVDAYNKGRRIFREHILPVTTPEEREVLRTFAQQVETLSTTFRGEMVAAFNTQVVPLMTPLPADQNA